EQTAFLEADLHEGGVRQEPWIAIAGLDVVRDPDGHLRVLEDNVRTPSGLAYALAARELVGAELGLAAADGADGADGAPLEIEARLRELLQRVLARRPPHDDGDGVTVLLTDGERNSAFYEHRVLASLLGLALVGVADLRRRAGRLWLRADGRPVSVVYRRTDEERLREPGGRLTPFGELALEPLREGTLRVVNGFGTGVADDKLVYGCVERMIEFYLGEQPAIGSVATFDLGVREQREQALERLEELVLKPRDGHGGTGVLIGPRASRRELARARETLAREPERWLAQETVVLSTHPTLIDGELVPRHVDLRPFVFYDGREASVLAGGLTRVALREGSLIVNSSRSGGGKDTWVLA
ncbi:MAG TPA: circularly permuted type 2 ATP-grasp protein, partial [Solirubrobacteraceae bacterium]|nr:circularly permuted type 2 ATP-grasp protein [Solirubrobacteraceae bacterium]